MFVGQYPELDKFREDPLISLCFFTCLPDARRSGGQPGQKLATSGTIIEVSSAAMPIAMPA